MLSTSKIIVAFLFILLNGIICARDILDTSYPVLITESLDSSPESRSYFGYTVSLAQGHRPPHSDIDPNGWIFIGAPRANASASMYDKTTKEPGVVWRCSLGLEESRDEVCTMMNVDPIPTGSRRKGFLGPGVETFDEACIGSTMEVSHGRFLACGHRWRRHQDKYVNGICYWFANDSQYSYISTDQTMLVSQAYEHRLIPLMAYNKNAPKNEREQNNIFNYTNEANKNTSAYEWQVGLAGMSVHLFTGEKFMPNLLIGAPNVRDGAGAVVLYKNNDKPDKGVERPNRDPNSATFSEFVVANRGVISTKAEMFIDSITHRDEYFGYSVTSGRYFNKDKVLYAAGSPRASLKGEVVIFEIPPNAPPNSNSMYKRQIMPVMEIKAPGKSFGSYFGSVIHTADFNEDGLDELVVGAPMFSSMSSGYTKDSTEKDGSDDETNDSENLMNKELGDHGCIYFYKFQGKSVADTKPVQTLSGSKAHRARFGSAISSIRFGAGEIYLVVGAPYESSHDGTKSSGAVYLYKYNDAMGKFGDFVQRIAASKISSVLNGFGSSLSIPEDIDINGTPDMSIGSFKSGHAVLLRTRPKIIIKSWMEFKTEDGKTISNVRRGERGFNLWSCFKIDEVFGLVDIQADIWVKVKFGDQSIRFDKTVIEERKGNTKNEVIYQWRDVTTHVQANCKPLKISPMHQNGIGMDDSDVLRDYLPFYFTQEVWYNETFNRSLSVLTYYTSNLPRQGRQANVMKFSSFEPRKPSPEFSKASANISVSPTDCKGDVCRPKMVILFSFHNDKNESLSSFELGSSKKITMRVFVQNLEETAPQPKITLNWNYMIEETSSGWIHSTKCKNNSDTQQRSYTECPLGQYIKRGRNVSFEIQLNMGDIFVKNTTIPDFKVTGIISFGDLHILTQKNSSNLPLIVPKTTIRMIGSQLENVTLRGPLRYETKPLNEPTTLISSAKSLILYLPFRQKFTIEVRGASVGTVLAEIKLPVARRTLDSDPILLVKEPQHKANIECKPMSTSKIGFYKIDKMMKKSVQDDKHVPNVSSHEQASLMASEAEIHKVNRRRREVNETDGTFMEEEQSPEIHSSETDSTPLPPIKPVKPKRDEIQEEDGYLKLTCEPEDNNCISIICTATNVKGNSHIHLSFDLYPVKDSIDNLMKTTKKSMVHIEGSGIARIFESNRAHKVDDHEDKDVTQTTIFKQIVKEVSLWIYIAAGLGGLIIIILIIVGLYMCGFFKREKLHQLKELKAEHRKSMAAARASMMPGLESLDELMAREHRKDKEESSHL